MDCRTCAKVVRFGSREHVQQRSDEQIVDLPLPQITEEIVEVVRFGSREHVQQRSDEQIVELPLPQITEEIVEVVRFGSREHVQQRSDEQIVELPLPQITEEIVGGSAGTRATDRRASCGGACSTNHGGDC